MIRKEKMEVTSLAGLSMGTPAFAHEASHADGIYHAICRGTIDDQPLHGGFRVCKQDGG